MKGGNVIKLIILSIVLGVLMYLTKTSIIVRIGDKESFARFRIGQDYEEKI